MFHRSVKIINLDPSNVIDRKPEEIYDFDITDYISSFDIQEMKSYGPNGSIF